MNSFLHRKEFIGILIDVIGLGINHNRLEDAEVMMAGFRVLRPDRREIETFDAWIAMKRGLWQEARRTLHELEEAIPSWSLGKALLAYCRFAMKDSAWETTAQEVIDNQPTPEAADLARTLLRNYRAFTEKGGPSRFVVADDFSSPQESGAGDTVSTPPAPPFDPQAYWRA